MIAKLIEQRQPALEVERPAVYELFTTQIVKDVKGNDVEIPRSLGRYTLEQLESQKAEVQKKIDAIVAVK